MSSVYFFSVSLVGQTENGHFRNSVFENNLSLWKSLVNPSLACKQTCLFLSLFLSFASWKINEIYNHFFHHHHHHHRLMYRWPMTYRRKPKRNVPLYVRWKRLQSELKCETIEREERRDMKTGAKNEFICIYIKHLSLEWRVMDMNNLFLYFTYIQIDA